ANGAWGLHRGRTRGWLAYPGGRPTGMTQNRALQIASGVLFTFVLVALLFHFSVYVSFAVNLISFPFDYDQGEGFELVDVMMFAEGRWPYQDTETYPFYSSNYPPLFHLPPVPFMWIFGPGYWYGRLLGFLGTLVCAALIGYAVYRDSEPDGRNRTVIAVAVLSALAFLGSNTVYHIGPLFRQHMTMVLFEVAAIVVLQHAVQVQDSRKRWQQIAFGLGMLIIGGYTKQLAAITAIAALVFLVIRNPRRGVIGGLAFTAVGVAIFAWMNISTGGQWWLQAVAANVNEFYPDQSVGLFRLWWRLHNVLIIPAVLYVIYELYWDRLSAYSIWFVFSLVSGVASGTWGAGDSYFATTIAATAILSGLFFVRTLNGAWQFPADVYLSRLVTWARPAAPALVALSMIAIPVVYLEYARDTLKMPTDRPVYAQVANLLGLEPNAPLYRAERTFYDSARLPDGGYPGGYADIGHFVTAADVEAGWQITAMVRAAEGPVITEDASFSIQAGKDVITNPTQLRNLYLNGFYEGDALIEMINAREFELIVYRAQFYPATVLEAVAANYEEDVDAAVFMNGFRYIIMRPKEG
ncbi:MAG: hypothetical protein AAF125_16205, partial [Chloroflexota bacterium]